MKFDDKLLKMMQVDITAGNIPMLLGEPGIGKSSYVLSLAEMNHTKCFVLACNQLADKADLTGARLVPVYGPVLDDNGNPTGEQQIVDYEQIFYPHAIIRRAIQYAKENPREYPILFMDELNRTTPDVTSECLSIPTLRAIGNAELPKNLRIVTAGNDKGNVTSLDEASISRFVLYHVEPDLPTFLAVNPNLNPFVKNVLQQHPEVLFCKTIRFVASQSDDPNGNGNDDDEVDINEIIDEGDEMNQITTPRTLTSISNWLNGFSNQDLLTFATEIHVIDGEEVSLLEEALNGHTGKTNFTKLLVAEIVNNVNTINNSINTVNVPKPMVYDQMKQCADITALNQFISTMTDNDKSGSLVYALYEKEDNTKIIQALAPTIMVMNPADTKTLSKLSCNDLLDEGNKHVLMQSGTTIASTLMIILDV